MGDQPGPEFARELHHTLLHLYDPVQLRRSPLAEILGVSDSSDPTQALQRILLAAVEALKPDASVPHQSNAWRIYHILNQRYAGQFPPEDIAVNLAVSSRQLRRLQVLALQALADYLWAHYDLGHRSGARLTALSPAPAPEGPETGTPSHEGDLELLRDFPMGEPADM